MKLALCYGDVGGCGYYRVIQPGFGLRERGHEVRFIPTIWQPELKDNLLQYHVSPEIKHADAVVLQRVSDCYHLQSFMAVKPYTRVIHEVDDNVHVLPKTNLASFLYGPDQYGLQRDGTVLVEAACRIADHVTTATPTLTEHYHAFNQSITTLPNAIDDKTYAKYKDMEIVTGPKRRNQIRIGWTGAGAFHQADLKIATAALGNILSVYPHVRVVFSGGKDWPDLGQFGDRIEMYEGLYFPVGIDQRDGELMAQKAMSKMERFYNLLTTYDLDIGIAPIEATPFNNSKSDLKILEHGVVGIPMLCSDFGPYKRYAEEPGASVALATEDDWFERLQELVEDHDLRAKMAAQNLKHIGEKRLVSHGLDAREAVFRG